MWVIGPGVHLELAGHLTPELVLGEHPSNCTLDDRLWAPLEDRFAKTDGTLDEDRFSKFFRDFLMSGGRYVAPKDTFADFEARYEATGFSPKQLAAQLTANSGYYEIISGAAPDRAGSVTTAGKGRVQSAAVKATLCDCPPLVTVTVTGPACSCRPCIAARMP